MLNKLKNSKNTDAPAEGIAFKKSAASSKTFRRIIVPIAAVCVAIIVFIVATVFNQPTIEENYFVSDDTKTAISLKPTSDEAGTTSLVQTHLVYTYDGENVSGLKTYFEYPDAAAAKSALESLKDQPEFKGATVEGKYIVVTADESQYKGLTASDIKQQADALKAFQESKDQEASKESPEE